MIRKFKDKHPILGQGVYIDEQAVIIGDVEMGDNSSLWPTALLRGDLLKITIGKNTSIQDGTIGHTSHASAYHPKGHALTVGDNVTVGHQVVLHGCTIHSNTLIGMQSVILDGAVIESYVMLGAGSLVSPGKVLESGFLYIGRPAVKKRPLTEDEKAFIAYSAKSYVALKNHYL